MNAKALLIAFFFVAAPAVAVDSPQKDFDVVLRTDYYDLHRDAAASYGKKDYVEAFGKYKRLACAGDKPSQATIGEMYLMGQGVERNDLVGYEWVKLASEYNFAGYNQLTKTIEDKLTPTQSTISGQRVSELRSLYGMRATNMSCELRASTWSASNMKNAVQCTPDSINGNLVLLHRCVDDQSGVR